MSHKGMGTHQSSAMVTDTWLTPPELLSRLGKFDLDPCAAPEPRPWPTADTHFVREQNGLILPWIGRVWMNPPYGPPPIVTPWMRRLEEHGNGLALIFARTETEMFHDWVWNKASSVLFFKGRLYFHYPNGARAPANAGAPSCLVAYGKQNTDALHNVEDLGCLVILN